MDTINVNDATPEQLAALLGLRPDELERVVAARPFTDLFTFRRTLPFRVAMHVRSLEMPRLDLNAISEEDLVAKLGLTPAAAQAVVKARPYYFVNELNQVPGLTTEERERLVAAGSLSKLSYVDKSSGRAVSLDPDASKVLVNFRESEAGEPNIASLGLKRAFGKGQSGPQVFDVPETESGGTVLGRLKQKPGVDKVTPGFREGEEQRFLDPEYCIVQFRADVPLARQEEIIAEAGLEIAERHRSAGLFTLRIPPARVRPEALTAALQILNMHPEVEFAEPNYLGFDDMESAGFSAGSSTWHLDLIRLAEAWQFGKGSPNVIVAVVDSGVDLTHPALSSALLRRGADDDWDFTADGGDDPLDEDGHGTFIAGILAGNGTLAVQGICPDCRLLPLRIPLTGQTNSYARRADAIRYAVDFAGSRRLVINTSWKTTGDVAVVRNAIASAVQRGAVVVASAGNDPEKKNQQHFPSDYPNVLSVAAVGPDRRRAEYSFYGDRINVAAPGGSGQDRGDETQDIRSAAPGGGFSIAYGTSFAAPHVAAVAALILAQDPTLTPGEVQRILQDTAIPLPDDGVGRGLLNAAAAVMAARTRSPAQPQPTQPSDGLAVINRGDVETLIRRYGLSRFTAQLLVSRRPFTDITRIRNTLGLTEAQYAALSTCGKAAA